MTPIIVPISTPQKNCIIQAGTRYCEDTPITRQDVAVFCLILLIILGWAALWFKIADKTDRMGVAFICMLGIPLLLGLLIALLA